jgi:glycosyltransferase involved in cell wall biosynthesis
MDKNLSKVVSILVPVYNERPYIRKCLQRIVACKLPDNLKREIIIVDDASTDGTADILDQFAAENADFVRVCHSPSNQGKGASIQKAVELMNGDYAIFQDADLEYDPRDYELLLKPLREGVADVVYGSRFAPREMRRVFNFHHSLGNGLLTFVSNLTTGLNLTDMETGYKAFRSEVLKTVPLRSKRFGIEPEITAKIAKRGCIVYEVPINYRGRSYMEGKKINWRDGFSAVYTTLKYWFIDDCFDDLYGYEVLHTLSGARHFNEWLVARISSFFGDRILEIGAGVGNISRLLPKKERLVVSDIEPRYLELLTKTYADNDTVAVERVDIAKDEDVARLKTYQADTVVCLNVLEHIEDDFSALKRMNMILEIGGRLILLVPQYRWLFGSLDAAVGHHRRYSKKRLLKLLEDSGFKVSRTFNFNFFSIAGWWFNSKIFRASKLSKIQLKMFDMMVPLLRILEFCLPLPGISLVCVAVKK